MKMPKKAFKRAEAYVKKWGDPGPMCKARRSDYEMHAIEQSRKGLDPAHWCCSTSEWITVALGLGRHDLLREPYQDPVNAWMRLDRRQRNIVRVAVGDAPWMIGEPIY